ncbi:MAG: hypothetical protein KGJ51_08265, partial [Acidobacteriota bacterium]|nr:hypothetical protein [Acidobacteriota bacterium]
MPLRYTPTNRYVFPSEVLDLTLPRLRLSLSALLLVTLAAPTLVAQSPAKSDAKSDSKSDSKAAAPEALPDAITEGSVKVGSETIDYKAVAGTLTVGSSDDQDNWIGLDGNYLPDAPIDLKAKPEDRPATARMYYVAYFAKNAGKNRPITFLYNGGPGSSTMYLHMGAFGPMRVEVPQDLTHKEGAPYDLVPNQYSLLDVSDLVFIDAPDTGFSRI